VDALGDGVAGLEVGQRVWIRESAWQRADGTAQEYVVLAGCERSRASARRLIRAWRQSGYSCAHRSPLPHHFRIRSYPGSARDPSPDERCWLREVREPWGMRRFNWLDGRVLR